MAIILNTWYTTSDTDGTVKLTGGASGKPEYGVRLRYKANSNSATTNKTNITVQLQVRTTSSSYNTYGPNQTTTIQGTALSAKAISKFTVNSWVTFGERTFDVEHDSDGTKTITLSGSFTTTATTSSYGQYALKSGSVSASVELPTIPRYAAITAFSLSRTINTITMSYSVDSTIDSTQYSLNDGSWTTYPSDGIITGLNPATTYNVKIRVKRTDSQLWTTSDNKSITTYDYAKITEAPNIDIGNSATVKYTNPGEYTTAVGIYNTAGSVEIAAYRSTSGGTYTFNFTTTEINNMYAQTPNANQVTLRYYLRTTCNGSNYYNYVDKTFSVVKSDPTFSNFTYQDINSKTLALTGDSSKIIKKYSNLKVTISAANKMVAKNLATPVNYNVIAGNSSVSVAYSSTADVTGTINNVNSNDVTVYAVDSRGNQTAKSKSFSVVNYTECSIKTLRIDRVDGVGENIQLTMTGTYSTTNFGTTTNNIKTAQLRMKAKTASSYGDWVSILNRLSISGGKITADNITISDVTFALGTEYDVQIRITDELAEDIETASISDGTVLWSAVKGKGVNFGGLYDPDEGGELQVNGKKVQGIEIIDNLSSSSTIAGLSANQGRVLNNKFGNYLMYKRAVINLSSLDQNTYYPVVGTGLPKQGMHRLKLAVELNSGTKPSWSTHNSGFSCNLDILNEGAGWGTTNGNGIVLEYDYKFADSQPVSYTQLTNSSRPVFWCRGGGQYYIWTDYDETWTIYQSSTTLNSQTFAPVTTLPAINFAFSTIQANINAKNIQASKSIIVVNSSEEASCGVASPYTNRMYMYANGSGRGIYDTIMGTVIGVTGTSSADTNKRFYGIANRAYNDEDGNKIKHTVAYSNTSGTSGTVTLSASAANYKNIRITYKNDDGQYGSTTISNISNANGTTYGTIVRKDSGNSSIMLNSALFAVSGTSITISRNTQANVKFGSALNTSDANKLSITKVELWS